MTTAYPTTYLTRGATYSRAGLYALPAGTWSAAATVSQADGTLVQALACNFSALGAPDADGNTHALSILATAAQTAAWPLATLLQDITFTDTSDPAVKLSAVTVQIVVGAHTRTGTDADDPLAVISGDLAPVLRGEPGADGSSGAANTDELTEGATNLYYTAARVRATVLTGLSTAAGTIVTAAHTVLQAIGFLQKQISDAVSSIATKQDTLVSGTSIKTINSTSLLGSGDIDVSASPGGASGQVQFNNGGAFGASQKFIWDSISNRVFLYNAYTDTNNYERVNIGWDANWFKISAAAAGTGDGNKNLLIESGAVSLNNVNPGNTMWFLFGGNYSIGFQSSAQLYLYNSQGQILFGNPWDIGLKRSAAGILGLNNGSSGGAAMEFTEISTPSAPSTNSVRIYAEDNGSGKTKLMARFATGSPVQIAIEP